MLPFARASLWMCRSFCWFSFLTASSKIYRHQLGWNIQSNKARCRSPELPSLVCQQATAVLRKPPVDLTDHQPPPPLPSSAATATDLQQVGRVRASLSLRFGRPGIQREQLHALCICGVRGRSSVGLVKSSCSSILLCIYIHLWIWCWMYALKERPESGHQNVNMPVENRLVSWYIVHVIFRLKKC